MSQPPAATPAETFRVWLRRELLRALKVGAGLLAAGLLAVLALDAVWPGFNPRWRSVNYQLTHTALEQHPLALARTFGARLGGSEYGWGLFSWTAPFNASAAQEELRADYPDFIGVRDGAPVARRRSTARLQTRGPEASASAAARAADYLRRYEHIESRRFTRLYGQPDKFSPPDANAELGRVVTKLIGLPDAAFHVVRSIISGGIVAILLFSTVLAFAAVALAQAQRPARRWLKVLVWPWLASTLIWAAILVMSVATALFGGFTPDTSALALLAASPFLLLLAKLPLRYAESLVHKPKPWDGIDRRKNRRPADGTVPPMGGA